MDYKMIKRLLGGLMAGAGLVSLVWVLLGKNLEGLGLIALALLLVIGGVVHLFIPGEEPKSVLSKLVEEAKHADEG